MGDEAGPVADSRSVPTRLSARPPAAGSISDFRVAPLIGIATFRSVGDIRLRASAFLSLSPKAVGRLTAKPCRFAPNSDTSRHSQRSRNRTFCGAKFKNPAPAPLVTNLTSQAPNGKDKPVCVSSTLLSFVSTVCSTKLDVGSKMEVEMTDAVTVGSLVAGALSLGSEAIVKGAVGEAVKDAYKALKTRIIVWAARDVRELGKTPGPNTWQPVIAEAIDQLSREDQEALRDLAQTLTSKLMEQAPMIGLDLGQLDALEVQLGNISVTQGIGVRIRDTRISGTLKVKNVSVGSPPGKP